MEMEMEMETCFVMETCYKKTVLIYMGQENQEFMHSDGRLWKNMILLHNIPQ
jgi:hypothetical protein